MEVLLTVLIGSNLKQNEDPSCPNSGGNFEFTIRSWCSFSFSKIPGVITPMRGVIALSFFVVPEHT
jgi:hypothetical protein